MRYRILIFLLAVSGICYTGNGENKTQDIPDEVVKRVDPSVVAIQHEKAVGSGFIIDPSGYIITNGHVVRGDDPERPLEPSKAVTVILSDERKFPAKVLGLCMNPDVALIKIDAGAPLKAAELADSSKAQIGQKCFAVGTPMGLKRTFTSGILSNVDRTDLGTFTKVIQTDAAINPGNSGGPLFDSDGKVLGINTYGQKGNNLGFTIPSNVVKVMRKYFEKYGRFRRADLPFFFTSEIYDELGKALQVEPGMLVTYVLPGSPADKAGLKTGDIITEIDGKPIKAKSVADMLDINWELVTREIGSKIEFTVERGKPGKRKTLKVKGILEEDEPQPQMGYPSETITHRYERLGLNFEELSRKYRVYFGLSDDKGVLVTGVTVDSAMAEAGVKAGDIITSVDDKKINDLSAFKKEIENCLSRQEKVFPLSIARRKVKIKTAVAPDYELKASKVLVVVPGKYEYLDLILREMVADGADIALVALDKSVKPGIKVKTLKALKGLKAADFDGILFCEGSNAIKLWKNKEALALVKEAVKSKKVVAGIGDASLVLVAEKSDLSEKKFTTSKENSGTALKLKANYTGSKVEKDGKMVTSTGFDRKTIRSFLKSLQGVIKANIEK